MLNEIHPQEWFVRKAGTFISSGSKFQQDVFRICNSCFGNQPLDILTNLPRIPRKIPNANKN